MMKILIVDDEPLARALLKDYLKEYEQCTVVGECGDGFEALKLVNELKPDLIFLDVQMPKINGFEFLELLDEPPGIIFTTAFEEYAIKAFDANAIDYLLKPFSEERLRRAIEKFTQALPDKQKIDAPLIESFQVPRIVVKDNHQIHIIPYDEIQFLEAADDYVKIHSQGRYFLKKNTLTYYENLLPGNSFCRVHRTYIVPLNNIAKVEPWEKDGAIITLKHKAIEIPVSKAGYVRLKGALKW
jgi:two-component system LytT family response regulator